MAGIKLERLPERTPVKVTVTLPPDLHRALSEYAAAYEAAYGQAEPVAELVPAILAAFLESYITHLMSQTFDKSTNSGMPVWLSVCILALSMITVTWYFVIWPVRLARKGFFIKEDGIVNRITSGNV